jgi:hypothetical protein
MEAQLTESSTFPAQIYANSFFSSLPTDARFLQNTFQKIVPSSGINGKIIEFILPRFDAANVYQIQDTYVEVRILITKSDGITLPNKTDVVAPVNNVLHSLFEAVRLTINDIPITQSPDDYQYKAYITSCLSYSTLVKGAQLQSQGYYGDLAGHFGPVDENTGFNERNALFRVNYEEPKEGSNAGSYRPEGTVFMGRLYHDLVACETGLPPNTKIKFDLVKAEDAFILMRKSGSENFKVKIENICLYIPVAQLAAPVFNEINSILTQEKKPKVVTIHYRRIDIRPIAIPKNKVLFFSDKYLI